MTASPGRGASQLAEARLRGASWAERGLGLGVCVLRFGECADSAENVCTRVRRGGPGALVSFSPAIVHDGGFSQQAR